ncbi:MAG: Rad52/Rad22 family DNA repair protein, partial [Oscillospiraceae bacterium]
SAGKQDAHICGTSIFFESRGWVTKWDGAEDTDIEPIKGGLSDSMKRAAVQWGVGRVLYNMDAVWVDIEKKGKSFVIKDASRPKMNKAYLGMLDGLHQLPAPASGTQAQLTPKDTPSAAPKAEIPPAQEAPPTPKSTGKTTTFPAPAEPEYEYTVQTAKVQRGMNSTSTSVVMEDRDGKRVNAFARGERKDLSSGVRLKNVKLTQRQQNTVVFNMLEGYEIVEPAPQAA